MMKEDLDLDAGYISDDDAPQIKTFEQFVSSEINE